MSHHVRSTNVLKTFLFFFHATGFVVTSFLSLFLIEKGMSPSQIGWILAIGPIASLLSEPIAGYLSDKYKTVKKVILYSAIGMFISGLIMFQLDQFLAFAIFAYFLFFFMAPLGALGESLAQKTAVQTGVSFGSLRMWGSLGFAISSVATGYLLNYLGVENILVPFLLFTTVCLLSSWWLQDVKASDKPVQLLDAFKLLKDLRFVLFLLVALTITIAHRANDVYLSVFIKELNGDETIVGWAWFVGVSVEVFVFAISHLWFRKYHELTFIMFAALLYGIRFIGMSFASSPIEIFIYQPLHGIIFAVFFTASFSYVTKIVPEQLQSTGHVLLVSVFFGYSGIVGALAGGSIIEDYGIHFLYLLLGISSLIGLVLLIFYKLVYQSGTQVAVDKS
ncbi:PPP family 3-phenylpropionic acid transporter [Bacillus mesophilus]|uniref:MFS transporter n=1 Tax=Bacillus mesophilus TaxID=1808955 RepID=A0A6M0QBE7_9BACI|nr:MFS transporter [Bacillus mesophilus]MBM7663104.1 PPP family 3-phenylpropionic acid transporter [Bacillus mesophilus]NEY73577.1 MFS transporter [Bacillus mesophilus]